MMRIDFFPQLSPAIMDALSWVLIHSLWQITAVGAVILLLLQSKPSYTSTQKHNLLLAGLSLVFLMSIGTFSFYFGSFHTIPREGVNFSREGTINLSWLIQEASPGSGAIGSNVVLQPFITQIWWVGFCLFALKLLVGAGYVQYLKNGKHNKKYPYLEALLDKQSSLLEITKKVTIKATDRVISPLVVGWIKPTILMPIALVNQLETAEIESILIHELAHIARQDWLVNTFQSILETLFYFHPVLWWMSNKLRQEREYICDEWAIQHGQGVKEYAEVILKVNNLKNAPLPSLALGMSDGSLRERIEKLFGYTQKHNKMKEKFLALGILLVAGIGFAFTKVDRENLHIPFLTNEEATLEFDRQISLPDLSTQATLDTLPKSGTTGTSKISIMNNGRSLSMEKKDGKITRMEVDGQLVDPSEYDKYLDEFGQFEEDFGHKGFHWNHGNRNNSFHFGGDEWEGFSDDQMKMLLKNLDRFKDFDMGGHMFHLDSMDFDHGNLAEMMEKLRESLGELEMGDDLNFDFNFGRDFHFDRDFDFGNSFDFDFGDLFEGLPHGNVMGRSGKISDRMGRAMVKDGLIKSGEETEIEITGKHLKINGKKQSDEVYEKYKQLFEDYSGIEIDGDSNISLKIDAQKYRKDGLRRI